MAQAQYARRDCTAKARCAASRRPPEASLRRALIRFALLAAALAGAGCASGPPGGPHRHGPPGEDGRPRPHRGAQVFISPSGQPFRAGPDAAYPVVAWFAQADADHDGRISRAEFRADADAFFGVVDGDGDGVVTMVETSAYETTIAPEITRLNIPEMHRSDGEGGEGPRRRGGGRGGHGGGGRGGGGRPMAFGGGRQGAAMFGLINEPEPIRAADADFSLSVTRAEWRAASDRRFDLLDNDHDGALTLAELPRTPAQGPAPRR